MSYQLPQNVVKLHRCYTAVSCLNLLAWLFFRKCSSMVTSRAVFRSQHCWQMTVPCVHLMLILTLARSWHYCRIPAARLECQRALCSVILPKLPTMSSPSECFSVFANFIIAVYLPTILEINTYSYILERLQEYLSLIIVCFGFLVFSWLWLVCCKVIKLHHRGDKKWVLTDVKQIMSLIGVHVVWAGSHIWFMLVSSN